jgi:hypothetical protein
LPFFSARFSVLPPRRFSAFFSFFFSTLRDAFRPCVYWLFCVSTIFLPHATNRTACPYSLRFMRVFLIFSTGFCICDNYGITIPFSGFYGDSMLHVAIRELLEKLNLRPFQKLPGTRRERFERLEQATLMPLPATAYEYADFFCLTTPKKTRTLRLKLSAR